MQTENGKLKANMSFLRCFGVGASSSIVKDNEARCYMRSNDKLRFVWSTMYVGTWNAWKFRLKVTQMLKKVYACVTDLKGCTRNRFRRRFAARSIDGETGKWEFVNKFSFFCYLSKFALTSRILSKRSCSYELEYKIYVPRLIRLE